MKNYKINKLLTPKVIALVFTGLCLSVILGVISGPRVSAQSPTTCAPGQTGTPPNCQALPPVTEDTCKKDQSNKFLGIIPVWYEYVKDYTVVPVTTSQLDEGSCGIVHKDGTDAGVNLKDDAVAIGLAVIDIMLRIGALVAVGFIMMGGYKYISSQGEPKNIEGAMATIINASIGLGIVVSATVLVAFIGYSLKG